MKMLTLVTTAAVSLATVGAEAGNFLRDRDVEQEYLQEATRDHARAVGGYNDPFTALSNLLTGRATDKDVAPTFSTLHAVPKYRALQGDVVPLVQVSPPAE